MENENILAIINKLVDAKVSIDEVKEVIPLIESSEFVNTYQLIENINIAIIPFGRDELKSQLKSVSDEYFNKKKVIKIKNIKNWTLPAIAACIFIAVGISLIPNLQAQSNREFYNSHSGVSSSKISDELKIK